MNIHNTYLFFPATPENEAFHQTIGNIMTDGNPINDMGDDIENDGFLYRHEGNEVYTKL